jgi:hypothetical protein
VPTARVSKCVTDVPLAEGFLLRNGNTTFILRDNIESRKNAIVVLFGDSGNKSPMFTIQAPGEACQSRPTSSFAVPSESGYTTFGAPSHYPRDLALS